MSFDPSRYQLPSSNWMSGYKRWPVPSKTDSRLAFFVGPGTASYSTPMSMSAFSTFQHGSASSFSQPFEQRWSLIGIALGVSRGEEREIRFALAAEYLQIDCCTSNPARLRERDRLRLDLLR